MKAGLQVQLAQQRRYGFFRQGLCHETKMRWNQTLREPFYAKIADAFGARLRLM